MNCNCIKLHSKQNILRDVISYFCKWLMLYYNYSQKLPNSNFHETYEMFELGSFSSCRAFSKKINIFYKSLILATIWPSLSWNQRLKTQFHACRQISNVSYVCNKEGRQSRRQRGTKDAMLVESYRTEESYCHFAKALAYYLVRN